MKGSVVKRCSCPPAYSAKGERLACKIKHGSWSFIADAGRTRDGKRRQVKRGGFATKAEAEAALAELIDSVEKGTAAHDERQTVAAYLETWLAGRIANGLRPTTARSYRRARTPTSSKSQRSTSTIFSKTPKGTACSSLISTRRTRTSRGASLARTRLTGSTTA